MKHYSAFDLEHGRLRLRQGKTIEPELAAALLGEGIDTQGYWYRWRQESRQWVDGSRLVLSPIAEGPTHG